MSFFKKLYGAFIKDDTGEVNLLTVMITFLMLMFLFLFVKAEVFNQPISEIMTNSIVQLISIAFGGVGVIGGIRQGVDFVNKKRAEKKEPATTETAKLQDTEQVKVDTEVIEEVDEGQLTANFNIIEFQCHDGTEVPDVYRNNVLKLAKNLQVLREYTNKRITITSGYRTPAHNRSVGGKPQSKHLLAQAADIKIDGMTPQEVYDTIEDLINQGIMTQGGLSHYPTFTHYDVRGLKARW